DLLLTGPGLPLLVCQLHGSSFPAGQAASPRPVTEAGNVFTIAIAVALLVSLSMFFLPWSSGPSGSHERRGQGGSAAEGSQGPGTSGPAPFGVRPSLVGAMRASAIPGDESILIRFTFPHPTGPTIGGGPAGGHTGSPGGS